MRLLHYIMYGSIFLDIDCECLIGEVQAALGQCLVHILVHIKEPGDSDWKDMGDIDKTFAEAEKLAQEYGLYKKVEETPVKRKTRSKPKNNDKIKPTGALTFNF